MQVTLVVHPSRVGDIDELALKREFDKTHSGPVDFRMRVSASPKLERHPKRMLLVVHGDGA